MCCPPCVIALLAPGDTWLQSGHWQQLDEVPAVETEEAVVVSDVAAQGNDVAGVLQAGGGAGEGATSPPVTLVLPVPPAPPPLASFSPEHPRVPGTPLEFPTPP